MSDFEAMYKQTGIAGDNIVGYRELGDQLKQRLIGGIVWP